MKVRRVRNFGIKKIEKVFMFEGIPFIQYDKFVQNSHTFNYFYLLNNNFIIK